MQNVRTTKNNVQLLCNPFFQICPSRSKSVFNMGKKKKASGGKKGGRFTKEVVENPLSHKDRFRCKRLENKAREILPGMLKGVNHGPQKSTKELLLQYSGVADPWSLTLEQRREALKSARVKARESQPKAEQMKLWSVGMKQCLREVGEGKLCGVIIEADSELTPMLKGMLCASDCPVLIMEKLSEVTKDSLGFPASCIGMRKQMLDEDGEGLEALKAFQADLAEEWAKETLAAKGLEQLNEENTEPSMEIEDIQPVTSTKNIAVEALLLKRPKKIGSRAFRPNQVNATAVAEEKQFVGQNFLSFGSEETEEEVPAKKLKL